MVARLRVIVILTQTGNALMNNQSPKISCAGRHVAMVAHGQWVTLLLSIHSVIQEHSRAPLRSAVTMHTAHDNAYSVAGGRDYYTTEHSVLPRFKHMVHDFVLSVPTEVTPAETPAHALRAQAGAARRAGHRWLADR